MTKKSLATLVAEEIYDFAKNNQKTNLLDEISIYGTSEKDDSAVFAFEWQSKDDSEKLAQEMAQFFGELKKLVIDFKKETCEQAKPDLIHYGEWKDGLFYKINYRFRIWPTDGEYENYERVSLSK